MQSKILLIIRLLKSLALVLLVPRSRICPNQRLQEKVLKMIWARGRRKKQ
uniref:Uncharacterized protein n=1 Tax=Picea sitchensis TaxID=3332 RepID=A9NY44_PICSI|nr:unknown [Picea sitchensis]